MFHSIRIFLFSTLLLFTLAGRGNALTFNFTDGPNLAKLKSSNPTLYQQIRGGLQGAGAYWSARIQTPVNLNITVDYKSLSSLGTSSPVSTSFAYDLYRQRLAMVKDTRFSTDGIVLSALPVSAPLYMVRNPGVVINRTMITAPRSILKAIGLVAPTSLTLDGGIIISSKFAYDFNRSDGIAAGKYDFIAVVAHELGHILGFTTIVDNIDATNGGTFTPMVMDLFRWSAPTVRDLSADIISKYFSLDGVPTGYMLCTGLKLGNKQTADHSLSGGLMVAGIGPGKRIDVSAAELIALDAMGWTLFP